MMMLSILVLTFMLDIIRCKLDYVFSDKLQWGSVVCFAFFVFVFINPFHVFYRSARFEAFRVMGQILIAPFGKVEFK